MPTPAPPSSTPDPAASDLAERAAALVNPSSGLANDYLNVFNEIVMMIDLLPDMPDLAGNIETWSPLSYRAYFTRSTLSGREGALSAYDALEPDFRDAFERCAADLSRAATAACSSILDLTSRDDSAPGEALARLCNAQAQLLRARLETITDMVNSGPVAVAA